MALQAADLITEAISEKTFVRSQTRLTMTRLAADKGFSEIASVMRSAACNAAWSSFKNNQKVAPTYK